MKIGVRVPSPKPSPLIDIGRLASKAEALGFESIWFPEHPIIPVDTPDKDDMGNPFDPRDWAFFTDPLISLAFAASATKNLKLGTGICLLAQHDPLVFAKQVSTLDQYSDGRFLLGVGAGWIEQEAKVMGVDFKRRWAQTREAALAIKELWLKDESSFSGEFYKFAPVLSNPKPRQQPHPPILVGSAGKRALHHVVEWGDEWMPASVPPARIEAGRRELDVLAREAGRDPASIHITMWWVEPKREVVKSYFDAGADRVVVHRPNQTNTLAEFIADFEQIADAVL